MRKIVHYKYRSTQNLEKKAQNQNFWGGLFLNIPIDNTIQEQ